MAARMRFKCCPSARIKAHTSSSFKQGVGKHNTFNHELGWGKGTEQEIQPVLGREEACVISGSGRGHSASTSLAERFGLDSKITRERLYSVVGQHEWGQTEARQGSV